jgi:hypothetical protein
MKRWMVATVVAMGMAGAAGVAFGQHEAKAPAHESAAAEGGVDSVPHPELPHDSSWVSGLMGVIALMFAGAMIIGPIVRASTPEEVPPAHSHDEPPGTSGHHGYSGTVDTHPPEEKHGGH